MVDRWCVPQPTGEEMPVITATDAAAAAALPTEYSGCHTHGGELYCEDPSGKEIGPIEGIDSHGHSTEVHSDEDHEEEEAETAASSSGTNCHFHAGVEHCESDDPNAEPSCDGQTRSYNLGIRIGAIFIVMATSALAVFAPILLSKYTASRTGKWVMLIVKQFGTGVIVATAFIHLLTHASLMFSSRCVGELSYEGATTAICMAGIMVAFLVEFAGDRYIQHRAGITRTKTHSHSHGSEHDIEHDAATDYDTHPGPPAFGPTATHQDRIEQPHGTDRPEPPNGQTRTFD